MSSIRLSFAEYAERAELGSLTRAGFEGHLRDRGQTFDFRLFEDWQRLFDEYQTTDRRRRHG